MDDAIPIETSSYRVASRSSNSQKGALELMNWGIPKNHEPF